MRIFSSLNAFLHPSKLIGQILNTLYVLWMLKINNKLFSISLVKSKYMQESITETPSFGHQNKTDQYKNLLGKSFLPSGKQHMFSSFIQIMFHTWTNNTTREPTKQEEYDNWPRGTENFHALTQQLFTSPQMTGINNKRLPCFQQYSFAISLPGNNRISRDALGKRDI